MDGKKQAEERVRQNEMKTEGEQGEGHEEDNSKLRLSFEATHVERVKWVGGVVRCSVLKHVHKSRTAALLSHNFRTGRCKNAVKLHCTKVQGMRLSGVFRVFSLRGGDRPSR